MYLHLTLSGSIRYTADQPDSADARAFHSVGETAKLAQYLASLQKKSKNGFSNELVKTFYGFFFKKNLLNFELVKLVKKMDETDTTRQTRDTRHF